MHASAGFLFGLLFGPEDGGNMILSPNYTVTTQNTPHIQCRYYSGEEDIFCYYSA
jgi:hypothetical protein